MALDIKSFVEKAQDFFASLAAEIKAEAEVIVEAPAESAEVLPEGITIKPEEAPTPEVATSEQTA